MSITKIVRPLFMMRARQIDRYATEAVAMQQVALNSLLRKAEHTAYGRNHLFKDIDSYGQFAHNVPLATYDDLKADIDRMRQGEGNVLWAEDVKMYAKSSGTTSDKSKFIPVSTDGLKKMHYQGGADTVALYLRNNPDSRLFDGKGLILGGSHSPNYNVANSMVGDLSAILIENINPLVNLVRVPKKRTALLSDFELKRERIAREVVGKNVTNLSGVPSWMLSVLVEVLATAGADSIDEVWPNLEVFFHGGISFNPYRRQYERIIKKPSMKYMETYNASEGFFAIQDDPQDRAMLLMVDYEMFYEFCPMSAIDDEGRIIDESKVVPLEGVEMMKNYAMIISNSCGLWRYVIGDTVSFVSRDPYKLIITGRTKSYINSFGEELIIDNAEQALDYACRTCDADVAEYTAAPVFMDEHARCRHQWLVEFRRKPDDMEAFAQTLDSRLQQLNSDYEAKRSKDITLQRLEIVEARQGLFDLWLKNAGKLGGQHKVPRLSNSRTIIDELLALNQQ